MAKWKGRVGSGRAGGGGGGGAQKPAGAPGRGASPPRVDSDQWLTVRPIAGGEGQFELPIPTRTGFNEARQQPSGEGGREPGRPMTGFRGALEPGCSVTCVGWRPMAKDRFGGRRGWWSPT